LGRPEYDVFYSVRIHKLVVNLHDLDDADVEVGDYAHFKVSKAERASRRADKAWKKRYESAIQEMKRDWDADFEGMKEQIKQGYEQALIDANANIEAAEVRMTEEIEGQRTEIMQEVESSKQEAIEQAESDAKEKADAVQSNLDSFKDVHQQLYDSVTADVLDIDEFLGDIRNITLDERLQEMNLDFEDRIRNIKINTANMLQGSRFDEPDKLVLNHGGAELLTSGTINRIRLRDDSGFVSRFSFVDPVKLEPNTNYYVTIE